MATELQPVNSLTKGLGGMKAAVPRVVRSPRPASVRATRRSSTPSNWTGRAVHLSLGRGGCGSPGVLAGLDRSRQVLVAAAK